MGVTMHIGAIVHNKGSAVHSIEPQRTLMDVVTKMLELRVSSLIVPATGGAIAGIITEHDIIRTLKRLPDDWKYARVEDVMTRDVFTAHSDDQLEDVIASMRERHIRHLPVMDGTRLAGILSIRDLINASKDELARHNSHSRNTVVSADLNALSGFRKRGLEPCGDRGRFAGPVDLAQLRLIAVVLRQRLGPLAVRVQARSDRVRLVVGAL